MFISFPFMLINPTNAQPDTRDETARCVTKSGKTWKTQGILRKYFKFPENSGNTVEIGFLINTLLSCNNLF